MLEKHYGPAQVNSTPEPRRRNPDDIQRDLGVNLEDSLFETGGLKRHTAPMPTQSMSILHAEQRNFAQNKDRFEEARHGELDRMNAEVKSLAQKLAEMKIEERDLDSENIWKRGRLEHASDELANLESRYSQEHDRLKRKTSVLEGKHEQSLRDSEELHHKLKGVSKRMLNEHAQLDRQLDDLRTTKSRLEQQCANQNSSHAQRGFKNVNAGVYDSSSGGGVVLQLRLVLQAIEPG